MQKEATVSRDIEAREIPSGTPVMLRAGDSVVITQSLGGSYTVVTPVGFLARIEGKDADALGEEVVQKEAAEEAGKTTEERVWDELKTCYDPEIPVNIVDLGLVYDCRLEPLEGGAHRVEIQMTLTAPGCGMGPVLADDVRRRVEDLDGVGEVKVDVVFDPPWNQNMMTEAAKLQLGFL
jgi:probable FeS assembly SUF system protein SufT